MTTTELNTDVAIVGGGFAGVVAARELTRRDLTVCLLEGRERLGGRTWTVDWHGAPTELGGQWIHWVQPHVWAEITRYGLPLYRRPDVSRGHWLVDGELRSDTFERFHEIYAPTWARLSEASQRFFPYPYEALHNAVDLEAIDGITLGERLKALQSEPDAEAICRGIARAMFNGPGEDGAWTQLLRRVAAAQGSSEILAEAVATYRLRQGSRALIDAIASDSTAELLVSTVVTAVQHTDRGVRLVTDSGPAVTARAALVTVPMHALREIAFEPHLTSGKQALIDQGQMTRGAMLWLLASGVRQPTVAYAAGDSTLSYARCDGSLDGSTLLNVFAPDSTALDLDSMTDVEAALQRLLPGATVEDAIHHDWISDRFSQQTWTMLRPRQLTQQFAAFQAREGALFFAGADFANGWFGFIDGAIESGIRGAREIRAFLMGDDGT